MAGRSAVSAAVTSAVAANGTINGCYRVAAADDDDGQQGQLRVLAADQRCKKSELAIQWNQKGPKGDIGAQGIAGQAGPKGDAGAAGLKGDQGLKSDQGLKGADGLTGADGLNGDQGLKGVAGAPGQPAPRAIRGSWVRLGLQGPRPLAMKSSRPQPRGSPDARLLPSSSKIDAFSAKEGPFSGASIVNHGWRKSLARSGKRSPAEQLGLRQTQSSSPRWARTDRRTPRRHQGARSTGA